MMGETRVSWNGALFCTCDGTDADERYIIEMLKDTCRVNGVAWLGWIKKVHRTGWAIIDSPLMGKAMQ